MQSVFSPPIHVRRLRTCFSARLISRKVRIAMIAEAKAELQQALDLDPHLLWARFYLAKIYIDQGLNEKAKDQLERGLRERPNVPHFLSLLGEVRRKLGDPEASAGIEPQGPADGCQHDSRALLHGPCLPGPEAGRHGHRRTRKLHSLPIRGSGDVCRAGGLIRQEAAICRRGGTLPQSHRARCVPARDLFEPGAVIQRPACQRQSPG